MKQLHLLQTVGYRVVGVGRDLFCICAGFFSTFFICIFYIKLCHAIQLNTSIRWLTIDDDDENTWRAQLATQIANKEPQQQKYLNK